MSKAKEVKAEGERSDLIAIVKDIGKDVLDGIKGEKSEKDKVLAEMVRKAGSAKGLVFPQADSTLAQYVHSVRSELGWTRLRRASEPEPEGDPTLSDLLKAKKMCRDRNQTPEDLISLVNDVLAFSSPMALRQCLEALIKFRDEA